MYSKVYWITSGLGQSDALMNHYDTVVTPVIRESAYHVGHQMIEVQAGKFLLVSNYASSDAAEAAAPMVKDLVGSMAEGFGMSLELIGEGETTREVS